MQSTTTKTKMAPPNLGAVDYKIVAPKLHEIQQKAEQFLETDHAALKSVLNFLNPDTKQSRFPDTVTNPTNLLRSIREYLIYANFDGTANSGRWSVAIQPSPGSLTDLSKFAVAIVDSSAGWPSDLYSSSSYVSVANGQDPRLDPNLLELLQSRQGAFSYAASFNSYSLLAGIRDGYVYTTPSNFTSYTQQLSSLKVSVSSAGGGLVTFTGVGSVSIQNPYYYSIPSGTYNLTTILGVRPQPGNLFLSGLAAIDVNGALLGVLEFQQAGIFSTGYWAANYNLLSDMNAGTAATSVNFGIVDALVVNIRIKTSVRIIPYMIYSGTATTVNPMNVYLGISSIVDGSLASFDNSQIVSTLRPLGMSALFTNILPELYAGGNIVSYSAPSGDIRGLYSQSNALGVMQNWEQLALLNKGNLMYDGPQKDGTFVFTQPWSENDLLLRTPEDMLEHSYQGIIISGQVSAGSSLTGSQAIGRLRVVTTYEYVTDSPIYTPKSLVGDGTEEGKVLSFLSSMQHALPNNKHLQYLNKVVKEGSKFLAGNLPTLVKGLTAISSML